LNSNCIGPVLKAKAVQLHAKLCEARGESTDFVASEGWLWRFSKRHGIRQLLVQGEKLSSDQPSATSFASSFQMFIEENHYTLNQIFNCDETGLYYKMLPEKTLVSSFEKAADGRKKQKERVTINACSNVLGTIKLPLLLIGKYKNPRCFKSINKDILPVKYTNQKNAWMNTAIFSDWFHNTFVPVVQKQLIDLGVEPKAVLVLDNCSAHPDEEDLISKDGKVIVKYLPANVTALIQPMDQGVLETLKRRYKRKILEELILRDEEGKSIPDFLKSINMLVVSNLIAASWKEIPSKTIQLSWRKIIPTVVREDVLQTHESSEAGPSSSTCEPDMPTSEEVQILFRHVGQNLSEEDVSEWLASDQHDQGYKHFNEDEIIANIVHDSESEEEQDSDSEDSLAPSQVSHSTAIQLFDGCLQWLQQQKEASVYNVGVLQDLRDLAAKKRVQSIKQKKLTDYFRKT